MRLLTAVSQVQVLFGAPEKERQVERLVFSFSTKSVLTDGINPSSMDEITFVMKSDFVGLGDGFNFICEADFIKALL